MGVRKLGNSWWVDFQIDHHRYRKRSPENSRSGALAYEALMRQKLARGESLDRAKREPEQTFEQFAWQWFEDYVVPNNKFSEQRAKKGILANHLIPFFGNFSVSEISTHHIEQFKAWQAKQDVSKKTVRNRLTVLSKCLSCAHEWLGLSTALPRIVWPKGPPAKTDYLTPDECELLLKHSEGILREMIMTALRTGMRQGELKGLQWSSVDWQNRSLTVRHSYCDVRKTLDTPKSNRERHIPLDIDIFEMLYRRRERTGYVFRDGNKAWNSPRLNARLAMVCKRAGLRKITWHVLRHTFASHLAMKGAPLNSVQALLGHATITTTMRYAHVAPSTLRATIELLNPKTIVRPGLWQPAVNGWIPGQIAETESAANKR